MSQNSSFGELWEHVVHAIVGAAFDEALHFLLEAFKGTHGSEEANASWDAAHVHLALAKGSLAQNHDAREHELWLAHEKFVDAAVAQTHYKKKWLGASKSYFGAAACLGALGKPTEQHVEWGWNALHKHYETRVAEQKGKDGLGVGHAYVLLKAGKFLSAGGWMMLANPIGIAIAVGATGALIYTAVVRHPADDVTETFSLAQADRAATQNGRVWERYP